MQNRIERHLSPEYFQSLATGDEKVIISKSLFGALNQAGIETTARVIDLTTEVARLKRVM